MKFTLQYTLFSSLVFIFCSSFISERKDDIFIFKKFPSEKRLEQTNYLKVDNLYPEGLCLYRDSLLFVRNSSGRSKYHFSSYNLKNRSFMFNYMESGRQPGQTLGFLSYGITDNYLWVYDIIKNKIILSNLDSVNENRNHDVKELKMPVFYYSVQLSAPKTLIASGDYESNDKLSIFNLSTGKVENHIAQYSQDTLVSYPRAKKMQYESFLFLKPSKEKCAMASRYADRIEMFDIKSGKCRVIKGPENYEPEVLVMKGNDGKELSTRNADTRYAFVKGQVTEKYLYLLYSGNNHESEHLFYGKFIYVYDWEGNPVKKLILKNDVLDFAITSDDSVIYTYNPRSKYIELSKL